jgi:hypothetical protein
MSLSDCFKEKKRQVVHRFSGSYLELIHNEAMRRMSSWIIDYCVLIEPIAKCLSKRVDEGR